MVTRVETRRAATRERIVEAASAMVSERGLHGLVMRDLAEAVGMRAPSLYEYFGSKAAIWSALFQKGYVDLAARLDDVDRDGLGGRALASRMLHAWIAFCCEDWVRYQLMFTRVLGDWSPSEDAYAASIATYASMVRDLGAAGISEQREVDLLTAMTAGLVAQQFANDPDGDRWIGLADDATQMFFNHVEGNAS